MFANSQIVTDDLPRAADIEWQSLDPRFRTERLIVATIVTLIVVASFAALQTVFTLAFRREGLDIPIAWIWLLLPLIAVPLYVWPIVSLPLMGYAVRDKDLAYRSGVLWRTVTAIPYNRIQHVEIDTSPLDRRYGLANLKIYTAGGAGGDLKMPGLSAEMAEQLRSFMLERIGSVVEQD